MEYQLSSVHPAKGTQCQEQSHSIQPTNLQGADLAAILVSHKEHFLLGLGRNRSVKTSCHMGHMGLVHSFETYQKASPASVKDRDARQEMQRGQQRLQPSKVRFPSFHGLQLWPVAALHSEQWGASFISDAVQATHVQCREGATIDACAKSTQWIATQNTCNMPRILQHVHCGTNSTTTATRLHCDGACRATAYDVEKHCRLVRQMHSLRSQPGFLIHIDGCGRAVEAASEMAKSYGKGTVSARTCGHTCSMMWKYLANIVLLGKALRKVERPVPRANIESSRLGMQRWTPGSRIFESTNQQSAQRIRGDLVSSHTHRQLGDVLAEGTRSGHSYARYAAPHRQERVLYNCSAFCHDTFAAPAPVYVYVVRELATMRSIKKCVTFTNLLTSDSTHVANLGHRHLPASSA